MSSLIAAAASLLVFCAPGYPGTSADAQPLVDDFVAAAAAAARWPAGSVTAVYDADEKSDLQRLGAPAAALAFVPWPFYVEHAAALHLTPLVQAQVIPVGAQQRWTLVMKRGRPPLPAGLAGLDILSTAGYAPDFVRSALRGAGTLPAGLTITASGQMLSGLRRAAGGEAVALLLDQAQAEALPSLPFAAQLQAVATSAPVPVALIAVVDARVPKARQLSLQQALLQLSASADGAAVLGRLRLKGFVLPDLPAVAAVP